MAGTDKHQQICVVILLLPHIDGGRSRGLYVGLRLRPPRRAIRVFTYARSAGKRV